MGQTTIRMVAEHAGCSIATVSRIVNGTAATSAELRRRVERAIRDLGYRPSELGRSLKMRRTRTIGIVVPSFTNPVFAASVAGVEARARESGYSVLVTATEYEAEREADVLATLRAQNVAGLVLTLADADRSAELDRMDREGFPYVLVYNQPANRGRPTVTIDNFAAAAELTRSLVTRGHRRIAFLAGRFRTSDRSRLRYEGHAAAMKEAGLRPLDVVELDYMGGEPEHLPAISALMRTPGRPTALIASNDILAISVMAVLRDLGFSVPRDVSVAGFDGIALARMLNPSLATVEQPSRAMGREAASRLLARLGGETEPGGGYLAHNLHDGGSIAPPPVSVSLQATGIST